MSKFTVVYEVVDEVEWGKTNPMKYEHNGVRAIAAYANTTAFNGVYNGGFTIGGTYNAGGTGGVGGFNIQDYRITPGIARFNSSTTPGAQAFTPPNGPAPLIGP